MSIDSAALIEAVRSFPCLYDKGHADFKKTTTVKENAWKTVSLIAKGTVGECQARWKYLREFFGRELRLIRSSGASGSGRDETYTSTWEYFIPMSFMVQHIRHRRSASNAKKPAGMETESGVQSTSQQLAGSSTLQDIQTSTLEAIAIQIAQRRSLIAESSATSQKGQVQDRNCHDGTDSTDSCSNRPRSEDGAVDDSSYLINMAMTSAEDAEHGGTGMVEGSGGVGGIMGSTDTDSNYLIRGNSNAIEFLTPVTLPLTSTTPIVTPSAVRSGPSSDQNALWRISTKKPRRMGKFVRESDEKENAIASSIEAMAKSIGKLSDSSPSKRKAVEVESDGWHVGRDVANELLRVGRDLCQRKKRIMKRNVYRALEEIPTCPDDCPECMVDV